MAARDYQQQRAPVFLPSSFLVLLLAIAGLLFVGLIVFRLQSAGLVLPIIALIAGCLGVLVLIRPVIGLMALIVAAAVVRVTIGTGTGSLIVASLLAATVLVAGWIGHRLINKERLILLPGGITVASLLLIATTLFAFLWGHVTIDPRIIVPDTFLRVQVAQAVLLIVSIGLLFVGADLFRQRTTRELFVFSLIAIGFVSLPFRVFQWSDDSIQFLNTAGLFGLWFVSFCWAYALANRSLPFYLRLVLGGGAVGWLLVAFFREGSWVSGWLPGLIALLAITVVLRPQLGMALIAVSAVFAAIYFSNVYDVLITSQQSEGSLGGRFGRVALIERNITFFESRLLLGLGPAGYVLYYVTFLPEEALSTHNNYVDILAQSGIIGLTSFAAVLGLLFVHGRRAFHRLDDPRDRATSLAVVGALPALGFALMLGDWLVPFVYNQTIAGFDHAVYGWLSLAVLCGIIAQQRQTRSHHA